MQALRAGYLGQVGPLLAAARWNASPAEQSTCDNDWNWDGAAECILSSENMFLALDPIGGRLVLAAARFGNEPFEWIGPRSQFVVGLGDPFEWLPEHGLAGDPQEISGAFADPINSADTAQPWEPYQSETRPGVIIMTNRQDGSRKTFRLAGRGIQVSIEGQQQPTQIPLALIGKRTYEPGGFALYQSAAGQSTRTVQENLWNLGHEITVRSSVKGAVVTVESFSDSRSLLNQEEDPNIGYPPGHFVPFPLSIIHLQPRGDFTVNLMLDKP